MTLSINSKRKVVIDGKELIDHSLRDLEPSLLQVAKELDSLKKKSNQLSGIICNIDTLKANIDNDKLDDAAFRAFVKTLF